MFYPRGQNVRLYTIKPWQLKDYLVEIIVSFPVLIAACLQRHTTITIANSFVGPVEIK